MSGDLFELKMEVRDYECDLQGIVNNAVYQHYLEHARHRFIRRYGLDFARWHREGLDAVATRIEMDFRRSLQPGDAFVVQVAVRREGRLRVVFEQHILREPDRVPVLDAQVFVVFLRNGRPVPPDDFFRVLEQGGDR